MVKKYTLKSFIEKARETHNDKYNYSKVNYVNIKTKICIICPKHGEFWQTPHDHLCGQGCPKCGNEKIAKIKQYTTEDFIQKAKEVHGDMYDYSKVNYINSLTKVCIVCPEHGEFWQKPANHLHGQGCPKCGRLGTTEAFIKRSKSVYGDKYDYSKTKYFTYIKPLLLKCNKCGHEFWQTPQKHFYGHGCPYCNGGIQYTTEDFIQRAKEVHGDNYDYSKTKYENNKTPVNIICPKHGEFWQLPYNHLSGAGCPKCGHHVSAWEEEVANYLKSLGLSIIQSDRKILDGKEIDILLPDYSIGIECDGLNFHSEKYKDKNYHLLKTEECAKKGIRLIHIFEDEWVNKKNVIESMLSNIFRKSKVKIYARKCEIKDVPTKDKTKFLDENHIQGRSNSTVNLGLYYNDELVSLMTFGKPRINMGGDKSEGSWELVRFCNKLNTNVIGGASKLFAKFVKDYNPKKIITYSDKRWATGNMYQILGFINTHDSDPNYFYIIDDERKNRFNFRKSVLIKEGYDPNKTEHEIMLNRDIYRIYDCGCKVWEWKSDE
jgi:hypothetical protein